MKKNSSSIIIGCTLGSVLLACGAALAVTFSWFSNSNNVTRAIEGNTAGAYFASGKGTEDDPYIINKPVHLYNLAWLQYIGYFNKDSNGDNTIDSQYYFKLGADITMTSEWTLPPIGTEQYPFIGNFDGADHTITGLKISTQIGAGDGYITKHPSNVTETDFNNANINIVGFFGIIGSTTSGSDTSSYTYNGTEYTYTSSVNSVKGIYLDDVTINAYATNTLCGMLAGYVNGELTNSGVHYGSLKLASGVTNISGFTNVSSYTLIGDYNKEKYKWEDDPSGSGDTGYGTSTDIKALHESLIKNGLSDGDTGKIGSKYVIPFKSESYNLVQGSGDTVTITKYGSATQSIKPSDYYTYKASTKGNNLGYYIGEIKTYEMSLDYNVSDFGIQSGWTNTYLKTPPDDVLTYLKSNGTHLIRLNNGFTSDNIRTSTFSYVQNGQVGNWTGNLVLPSNGIWVSPKENGTFKFVFYNASYGKSGNSGSVGLLFTELQRVTPGNYSSAFDANTLQCTGISYSCKYGYFEKTAKVGYEYYIAFYNTSSYDAPYIAYMDIGTNGGSSEDTRSSLTGFDFVEKQNNAIVKVTDTGYTKSKIAFTISNTSTSAISYYFRRVSDGVLYYYNNSSSGLTFTPMGTGASNMAQDETCNEATTSA